MTGPYRWWTAVGARISFVDDGLTFGTTSRRGTCVHFRQKLPSRLGFRPHSALSVTVADPDGLVVALTQAKQVAASPLTEATARHLLCAYASE